MKQAGWKKIVGAIAPTLGLALGGPMAGAAVKLIAGAVLGDENAQEHQVAEAVMQGMSPDAVVALRRADNEFKVRMKELDIDLAKLNADVEKSYLADVQDARKAHGGNTAVFWLGVTILITFASVMIAVLWGGYELMTGGSTIKDEGAKALVMGLVGTVLGYVSANAQQVVGYFFGSSKGSADKTNALAAAVMIKQQ
jgi:hypothetical protein